MCAIDDGEGFACSTQAVRKARKPRDCGECGRQIQKGERYEIIRGLSDGYWSDYVACAHCIAARSWLKVECRGFVLGGVHEDLSEHWNYSPEYRGWWLARTLVGFKRKWTRRDGTLMPVPAEYVRQEAA